MKDNKQNFSVSFEDMYKAYLSCRRRKRNKNAAKNFEVNALYNIQTLCLDINNKLYTVSPSQCFIIKKPTIREVFCASFRDRVVHHFVYNELNPVIEKMLIYVAANCRKGKGTDFAIDRVSRFLRQQTSNYNHGTYYLKLDLKGFFMSLDRHYLLNLVFNIIKHKYRGKYSEELKYLTEKIILNDATNNCRRISPIKDWEKLPKTKTLFNNSHGLPIGNLCSQLFANLYLNDLDHIIKSRHRHYSRYVDDFIVLDNSKIKLKHTYLIIQNYVPRINTKINNNKTVIKHVKYGIPYLGIIIKPYYRFLSKRRINQMYECSKKYKNVRFAYCSSASRKGMLKRYKGFNLMHRWYSSFDEEIKEKLKITSGFDFAIFK